MQPRFCSRSLIINRNGDANFLCSYWGLSGGGLCGHRPCGSPGTWPLWSLCVWGLGVSCSTARPGSCVSVWTPPRGFPSGCGPMWSLCVGDWGLAVLPPVCARGPRDPQTHGDPKKIAAFLARPRTKRSLPYVSRTRVHQTSVLLRLACHHQSHQAAWRCLYAFVGPLGVMPDPE